MICGMKKSARVTTVMRINMSANTAHCPRKFKGDMDGIRYFKRPELK